MLTCPLDFRYGREEMKSIFSEEGRLQRFLEVEAALAFAHAAVGNIPKEDADNIANAVASKSVNVERVKEIEKEIRHDLMSVVKALAEQSGDSGRYVHLGATSYDIEDTAFALQFKDVIKILRDALMGLRRALAGLSDKHKNTVMLGRTHGQAAVPITFGLKMAVYTLEVHRHLERLDEIEKRICVGKMSGATGTGAGFGPEALEIQKIVMDNLGLGYEEASSQIVGRDRYAEFITYCANVAASLEKFATEVRNLQRTEIGEVAEAFDVEKFVGSSTMAQKKNPETSENICGLARIIRGFVHPTYENIPLWHERDLTNSSSERFIIPHVCILTDDILAKMTDVFSNLVVNEERMMDNIKNTKGQVMSESVMMTLTKKGMDRQEAHEMIRKLAMTAQEKNVELKEVLLGSMEIARLLTTDELDKALDPLNYIGSSVQIVDNVLRKVRD
ncbi:MAG: adenylosuccinate lyase [Methanomassiliicoccales archaeon]|nr:MAG: adenylosuccinate lyase [Methanomassiliicoccales archaeon]